MGKLSNKIFRFDIESNDISDEQEIEFLRKMSEIGYNHTVSNDGIMSFVEINQNRCEMYIRDNGDSINSIYSILVDFFDKVSFSDCTDQVIFDNDMFKKINEIDDYDSDKTKKLFIDFRKELTSIDDILDKISEKGIDYIDDIDKEVLKTKNPS
jgi:hypothetical protein